MRVAKDPARLRFTFDTPGGVQAGTFAVPKQIFDEIGTDPARLKDFDCLATHQTSIGSLSRRLVRLSNGAPYPAVSSVVAAEFQKFYFPEGY